MFKNSAASRAAPGHLGSWDNSPQFLPAFRCFLLSPQPFLPPFSSPSHLCPWLGLLLSIFNRGSWRAAPADRALSCAPRPLVLGRGSLSRGTNTKPQPEGGGDYGSPQQPAFCRGLSCTTNLNASSAALQATALSALQGAILADGCHRCIQTKSFPAQIACGLIRKAKISGHCVFTWAVCCLKDNAPG